jgi:hypothetical protein
MNPRRADSRAETTPPSRYASNVRPSRPFQRPLTREQQTTVIYGMLCFILILVVLQLWLLIATMNAFLGGDTSVIWPAAIASVVCLLLNLGLLRYLYALEH